MAILKYWEVLKIQILRSHSIPITSQPVGINPSIVFCKAPQMILMYSQISGPVVKTTASQPLLCIWMIQGSYFYIDSYTVHGSCTSSKLPSDASVAPLRTAFWVAREILEEQMQTTYVSI